MPQIIPLTANEIKHHREHDVDVVWKRPRACALNRLDLVQDPVFFRLYRNTLESTCERSFFIGIRQSVMKRTAEEQECSFGYYPSLTAPA